MFIIYHVTFIMYHDIYVISITEHECLYKQRPVIKHIRSAPYHPAPNGLAERFIQTFKRTIKANKGEGRALNQRLSQFLFNN